MGGRGLVVSEAGSNVGEPGRGQITACIHCPCPVLGMAIETDSGIENPARFWSVLKRIKLKRLNSIFLIPKLLRSRMYKY